MSGWPSAFVHSIVASLLLVGLFVCFVNVSDIFGSSKRPKHEETAACDRKPEIEVGPTSFSSAAQFTL